MRRDAMRWLAWAVLVLLAAGDAAAQGRRDRDRRSPADRGELQRFETALGIQVREGRRPRAGVEVTLRPEGRNETPALAATTDAEGRAVVWGVAPGVWRLELSTRDEPDYVLSVRVLPERRAEQVGAAARDVDAPDLRWRFFHVTDPPPAPVVRRPEPARPAAPAPPPRREEPPRQEPAAPDPQPEPPPPRDDSPAEPPPAQPDTARPDTARPDTAQPAPPPAEPRTEREPVSVPAAPEAPPVTEPADEPPPAQPAVPGLVVDPGEASDREPRPAEPAYEPLEPVDAEPVEPADEPVPQIPPRDETLVRTDPQTAETPAAEAPATEAPATEPPAAEEPPTGQDPAEPPVRAPELPQPPVLEQEIPPAAAERPPAAVQRPEPPQAPMPPQPPEFRVVSAADGTCAACRSGEAMASIARTVAPGGAAGGGECNPGMAAAALAAARAQAGPSAPQPLDGAGLAAAVAPGASCQLFGVVLPPGARYRGFEYRANGQWCAPETECARAPGVLWPARPVIRELEGGATLVYGILRNTAAVPQRGELAVFYLPAP